MTNEGIFNQTTMDQYTLSTYGAFWPYVGHAQLPQEGIGISDRTRKHQCTSLFI